MIRDDYLLRQIHQLVEALAGARAELHDRVDLDAALDTVDGIAKQLVGLSLAAIQRLPIAALTGAAASLEGARRQALIEALAVAADLSEANGDAAAAAAFRDRAGAL